MVVAFIDYSKEYYFKTAKTPLPDKRAGKFVQIRAKDTEYLLLSPKELTPYHANLVEKFCLERGLRGSYKAEGKRFDIDEKGWAVVGGGKFEIDEKRRYIRLYDDSMAYGKFDAKGLKEKILTIKKMEGYEVEVE